MVLNRVLHSSQHIGTLELKNMNKPIAYIELDVYNSCLEHAYLQDEVLISNLFPYLLTAW